MWLTCINACDRQSQQTREAMFGCSSSGKWIPRSTTTAAIDRCRCFDLSEMFRWLRPHDGRLLAISIRLFLQCCCQWSSLTHWSKIAETFSVMRYISSNNKGNYYYIFFYANYSMFWSRARYWRTKLMTEANYICYCKFAFIAKFSAATSRVSSGSKGATDQLARPR